MTDVNTANKMTARRLLSLYADSRMAKILFLGFISGFPWLLIATMLSLWLREEGVSRAGIGLFGLLFGVYAVNALWAPLVDKCRLPWLSARLGQRRAWMLLAQAVILCALIGVFMLPDANHYKWYVALLMFIIALASATQDIAIDATRIELIGEDEPEKVGAGSAMATSGWWLGFGGGKLLALPLVEALQMAGVANAWQAGYLSMAGIVLLCMVGLVLFFSPAAFATRETQDDLRRYFVNPLRLYSEPLLAFIGKYTLRPALLLLFFIVFFKIGEAFLGRMSVIFYKEIGFTKSDIALLSGGLGTITVCVFAVFGSLINARYGLMRGIMLGGIAMATTNLLFAALAYYPVKELFVVAVVADQFTTSVSTVAFVAFISQLCDRRFTATHYAALGSLGNLSRTLFAASSGFLVDGLQTATGATEATGYADAWAVFFVITVLMVLPSLLVLRYLAPRLAPLMHGASAKLL